MALLGDVDLVEEWPAADIERFFYENAANIPAMASDEVERQLFFEWVRCPSQGVTAPFTVPGSPGLDKLDDLAFKHAERYEFQFMSSIKEELASQIECTEAHLALVKAMGLWLWDKALGSPDKNMFLYSPTRWNCITQLINASYNSNIPIIWGIATEKLTSTTQMTFLGLRIREDGQWSSASMPSVLNNKDVSYFVECDVVDARLGRPSLMLDYKARKNRRDWIRESIKAGLESIVTNAVDVCLEIGDKLNSCGCGDNDPDIEALTRLVVSRAGGKAGARRSAFKSFAESHQRRFHGIPSDMLELPLIFRDYEELAPRGIFRACNYVGYWWTERCRHSPQANDIRFSESRLQTSDKLFQYLEYDWATDGTHKTLREWSMGKKTGQIVKKVSAVLKKEGVFSTDDIVALQRCWPLSNTWNVEQVLE